MTAVETLAMLAIPAVVVWFVGTLVLAGEAFMDYRSAEDESIRGYPHWFSQAFRESLIRDNNNRRRIARRDFIQSPLWPWRVILAMVDFIFQVVNIISDKDKT